VPRATFKETSVGAFAEAFFAADTQNRIDLNASERRMIFVGNPEHAIFDRAVLDTRWRAGAPRAAFRDDRQLFGLLLASGRNALGAWFVFQLVGNHARRFYFGGRGHTGIIHAKARRP